MSKVLKGVTIYTAITLGIVLVLSMLVFGIMFISAGSSNPFTVFGYKAIYVNNKTQEAVVIDTEEIANESVIDLVINSGNYDVFISQTNDTSTSIGSRKIDNLFGLYKGETYSANIVTSFVQVTGEENHYTATINVPQLDGYVSYGDSRVLVKLPTDKNFVYNLTIVSSTGDISLNGFVNETYMEAEKPFELNKLSVTTTTGNFVIKNVGTDVEEIIPATEEGQEDQIITVRKLALDSYYFNTNGGVFDLTDVDLLSISDAEQSTLAFEINANLGDFYFNDILGKMVIIGQDIRLEANKIDTAKKGFTFNAPKGFFKIEELVTEEDIENPEASVNDITTEVINVEIGSITGLTSIDTTYGNIIVTTLNNAATLNSVNGNITVTTANQNITAISKYGDITITGYKKLAYLKNEKGSITATYTGTTEVADITNLTEAYNTDGRTTLNGIFANLTLSVTGNGSANVTFTDLSTSSESVYQISMNKGNATLGLNLTRPFRFKAVGDVKGTLGNVNIAGLVTQNGQNVEIPVFSATNDSCLIVANAGDGSITFASN